ncbi:hypothetical protein FQN60_009021 [Etheostoma spectabile]|uniref:3'-5' exonuclease domain-containing protein n=1 Tax=Etheostoma spectabile TaxID=54343 RepID=A0A5J5CRG3_9PERO|nr:hypothetical protein FQN60_009021 [Etheostoma spectabile]
MVLDEVQFLNTFKGKRVKLTLKTSSYLGVVQRINPNKTLILVDVEFPNEANVAIGNIHDHQFEEHLNVERFQPYKKTITFGDDEDEDEEEYINFVVIDEFQEKFGSAVMHIKKQHVIGVGADGVEVFKHGRLCWLQIATKSKVYLFDILILGARAFKNGLSMILESKHILKVIHDCRAIAGCLIAQFGVKLTNVFDTQVADVMCFYSETGGLLPDRVSTLQEVVSLHLKVPSSQLLSLQMMSQLTKVMALSVIHLQPLRLVLLDTIMTDYMALVDSYLNSSHYQPDELEHVSMESVLELPRELRQLEQTRRERQKRAADHYPLTEEGLLARFNPRSQTPSQPTLVTEEHGETQVESFEPANVESPSQVDTLLHKPPTSPPRVNNVLSVDIHASPNPQATASDLRKEMAVISPLSLGVGRGRTEVLMDTMGRGRPFEKEQSSIPALPAIGRGFLLQISQDQIPRESMGDITAGRMGVATLCPYHTHTLEVMSQPGPSVHDLPKDTSGMTEEQFRSTPKSVPSSLRQSFMSFRY